MSGHYTDVTVMVYARGYYPGTSFIDLFSFVLEIA
jgi:hypothetical protein